MTSCGPQDGITIEFPQSGVEIRPTDVDLRIRRRHYARGQFEATEEAGKLVDETTVEDPAAVVKVDGEAGHRMYLPEDGISFEKNLHEDTIAHIPLLDARKILDRGSVEKRFTGTDATVDDAVRYIINQPRDPGNVITGYQWVHPDNGRFAVRGDNVPGAEVVGLREPLSTQVEESKISDVEAFGDFDGESPKEALEHILDLFATNWWVEDNGVLYIGIDATRGQVVGTAAGDNELALSRYTVTRSAKTVNAVQLRGPIDIETHTTPGPGGQLGEITEGTGLRLIAEAKASQIDGSLLIKEEEVDIPSPGELERAAKRTLYQEVMDDISGSMEINGLASRNIPAIRELGPGDHIFVDDSIETECNQDVETGMFMVTDVHHRANARRGWDIVVSVTRVLDPGSVETTSVFYDPETDKDYETLEAYRQNIQ